MRIGFKPLQSGAVRRWEAFPAWSESWVTFQTPSERGGEALLHPCSIGGIQKTCFKPLQSGAVRRWQPVVITQKGYWGFKPLQSGAVRRCYN